MLAVDGCSPAAICSRSVTLAGWPQFFARAYLPVIADQRVIAIVGAYVDQTEQRDQVYRTFLRAATALCLLTGLSFVVPAIAWYRRTKENSKGIGASATSHITMPSPDLRIARA
jgi:hypothetical protein